MSILNRNELFYTALKLVVTQDNNPNWIFKTNLLHLDNMSTSLKSDNLIRPYIDVDSVYDYLKETAPYHVRFENYC